MGEPRKKIFIVEDDEAIGNSLEKLFHLKGYETARARNGEEGLAGVMGKERYDLILLDLMMPIMDGHEFLKALPSDFDTPVIVLTAGRDKVSNKSVKAVIGKPFNFKDLLETASKYLN